jgi:hypothetical protein
MGMRSCSSYYYLLVLFFSLFCDCEVVTSMAKTTLTILAGVLTLKIIITFLKGLK